LSNTHSDPELKHKLVWSFDFYRLKYIVKLESIT
jgi:hypothetical protein